VELALRSWDDQGVAVRERADVEEGEDVVVLVHLVARDLPERILSKRWAGGRSWRRIL